MKKIVISGGEMESVSAVRVALERLGYGIYPDELYSDKCIMIHAYEAHCKPDPHTRDSYDAVFGILGSDESENGRMIAAWVGNPHFRVVRNDDRLVHEVLFFLGEPEPLEIERKYLIDYPDTEYLMHLTNCECVKIEQTYMKDRDGENIRLRQRGDFYFSTQKKDITPTSRIEIERRLSESEYGELMERGRCKRSLAKDRYCLMYKEQYFEIDVYPFWDDRAIMEIELSCEDEEIIFPDFINIIKEVTGDKRYNNSNLAKAE